MELDLEIDLGVSGDGQSAEREDVDIKDLAEIELFKDAKLESLAEHFSSSYVISLNAGQKLLSVGQLNPKMYFLIEGQLRLFTEASDSKPFGAIDVGQSAGVLSAIEVKPSAESIVAGEDSRVLVIEPETVLELTKQSHAIATNFSRMLIQYVRGEYYLAYDSTNANQKERRISYVDELTGLHNRRWLKRILPRIILRCSTDQKPLSLIMCDIDKFKTFNEDFGELLENQALSTVSQLMLEWVRPTDMVARYELDVFLLVLPHTDLSGAKILANRLREEVSKTSIVIPNECVLPPITMSFGVTQLKGFVSDEVLIKQAEQALAGAKKHGGNWVSE